MSSNASPCPFCSPAPGALIAESELSRALRDGYPGASGAGRLLVGAGRTAHVLTPEGGVELQEITIPVTLSPDEGGKAEPEIRKEILLVEAARRYSADDGETKPNRSVVEVASTRPAAQSSSACAAAVT